MNTLTIKREVNRTQIEEVQIPVPSFWKEASISGFACYIAATDSGFIEVYRTKTRASITLKPTLSEHDTLGEEVTREEFMEHFAIAQTAIQFVAESLTEQIPA